MRIAALALLLTLGCASNGGLAETLNKIAEEIDDTCTALKLSQEHADFINATCAGEPGEPCEKGINEGYCARRPPGQCVKKGDRVQNADCANAIRAVRGLPATD